MEKIISGDTVEIISGPYKSLKEVPKDLLEVFQETLTPFPVVGSKFVVSHNFDGKLYTQFINNMGVLDRCMMCHSADVKLLHRPLWNRTKAIFTK